MPSITQDHLIQYENDGFVIVENFLDTDEDIQPVIDEYTQVLDQLANQLYADRKISNVYANLPFGERLTKVYAESGEVYSQYFDFSLPQNGVDADTPFWAGPAVFHMLRHQKLLDAAESFVGDEIYSNPVQHIRIKPPEHALPQTGDNRVIQTPWHQDNGVLLSEADDGNILTVWLPLTNATIEQGCLQVLPGSHKSGLMHHCYQDNGLAIHNFDEKDALSIPMQAGDVLFMHQLTCHNSLPNVSNAVRISFDLRYQAIGEPTGRPVFPGFVARSKKHPESELHDAAIWERLWRDTRDKLAKEENPTFNRWNVTDPVCA
ncbi:MAG: phytanoyl-CoA dioxygenase family protein [Candidatus Latescibacteria bacterium]|nr:phytanoyl-CoA dioxygenase family protein [Candidatus Latescibacterota bacterium]MBT5829123.1 phytanoyl-CoA dioxygenase family protein [Candidatus Latescibacterota bacterium]